jgi:hypothetical protein
MPEPYRVLAYNTAKDSENKIHDDAVAPRFGFAGGLVPGVDVYAYMTHQPLRRWGRAWLERGTIDCRLAKPVYDGEEAVVFAEHSDEGLALRIESHGEICAKAIAALPTALPAVPSLHEFVAAAPPPREARPPADETSLAVGTWLGMRPLRLAPDYAAAYLRDLRETDPIYAAEGLAHPGLLLRTCNWALGHNVVLGPWMHVGSRVQHLGLARVGELISACARVSANYEHKEHRFVELDALVLTEETVPVARIAHVAIYRPRQVADVAD